MKDDEMLDRNAAERVVRRKRNRPDLANFGQEGVEKGDNSRYLRHALATLNLPPIDISNDKQVGERIDWYFQHCMENDMKPTVMGLCNSLGISRDTINNWNRGDTRASTHSDLIKKAYSLLEALWEDYMMNGKINPVSGIFLISQEALDGVAVNCICRFAHEQTGPTIEWDDDIDLNYCNSTTEQWEAYFDRA